MAPKGGNQKSTDTTGTLMAPKGGNQKSTDTTGTLMAPKGVIRSRQILPVH
jgi:hypothetical protein